MIIYLHEEGCYAVRNEMHELFECEGRALEASQQVTGIGDPHVEMGADYHGSHHKVTKDITRGRCDLGYY